MCREGRAERTRQGGYRLAGDVRREPIPKPVSRPNPKAVWETETGNIVDEHERFAEMLHEKFV